MEGREKQSGRMWGTGLLIVAAGFLLFVYVLPALADRDDEEAMCSRPTDRQSLLVATGQNPGGRTWRVRASLQDNADCEFSLLGWHFFPSGGSRGSWSGKWSIPAGGHLSAAATIAARDEVSDASRVISGVVGGDVKTISAVTKDGDVFEIHPKLPPHRLRQHRVWLQHVRYFIRFYPVGDRISKVRLLDRVGKVKYSSRAFEGGIEGPMGSP